MATVSVDGLVSGINTQNIIDGLLKIQQQQVDRFALRKSDVQQKQTAFNGVETRLLNLQLDASKLSRSQNNPFTKQIVPSVMKPPFQAPLPRSPLPESIVLPLIPGLRLIRSPLRDLQIRTPKSPRALSNCVRAMEM